MAARGFLQIAPGRRIALNGVEWTIEDVHGQLGRLVLVDADGRAETRSFRRRSSLNQDICDPRPRRNPQTPAKATAPHTTQHRWSPTGVCVTLWSPPNSIDKARTELAGCAHGLRNRVPPRPVSAQEERDALTLPLALYDHALRLLRESPDGVPPRRGRSLSGKPETSEAPLSREEVETAVREALNPLPDDSATLHRSLARLGIQDRHRYLIRSAVADLPLPAEQRDAARALGRQLIRTGTTVPAVAAGLALLTRLGEPEDVPYLSVLGLLREFTALAVDALDTLDRQSAAVVWLATHTRRDELRPLVRALWTGDRQAIHMELLAFPAQPRCLSTTIARRVAEATRLPDLLDQHPSSAALLARTGRLLVRMGCTRDDPADLLAYRDALTLYENVVTRAGLLSPTLDNHATLLSLALDLSSGPGVLLDWAPGGARRCWNHSGGCWPSPDGPRRRKRAWASGTSGCGPAGSDAQGGSPSLAPPRPAGCASRWWRATPWIVNPSRPASSSTGVQWSRRSSPAVPLTVPSICSTTAGYGPGRNPGRCSSRRPTAPKGAAERSTSPSAATKTRWCGRTGGCHQPCRVPGNPRPSCLPTGSTPPPTTRRSPGRRPTTPGPGPLAPRPA